MSNDLRQQIYDNLNLKETEELIEIWKTNDRVEWSMAAFDAIREILQERVGDLPAQNEPMLEHIAKDLNDRIDHHANMEEFTDKENAPVFYEPNQVLWLGKWLNRAAIASIVAAIVSGLLQLGTAQRIVLAYFTGSPAWNADAWVIAFVSLAIGVGFQSAIYYFGFKALRSILQILMEMEFTSRGVKLVQKNPSEKHSYQISTSNSIVHRVG